MDRIVAILALLLIGASYVPMDQDRFADVMKSGAKFLLTDKTSAQQLTVENITLLDIDEFNNQIDTFSGEVIESNVKPDDLAYVIYTSGSTGASKGVAIKHVGLPNVFTSIQDIVQLKAGDKVAQITSLGFDASLCEIMMALGAGASLVLVPNEYRKDLSMLTKYYQEFGVTAAIFVPSVLRGVK